MHPDEMRLLDAVTEADQQLLLADGPRLRAAYLELLRAQRELRARDEELSRRVRELEGAQSKVPPDRADSATDEPVPRVASKDEAVGRSAGSSKPAAPPAQPPDLATLLEAFEKTPTAFNLARVITRMWFGEGMLDAPLELIERHPELIAEFNAERRKVVTRVIGAHRLLHGSVVIPPRARNPVYTVEPSRVLYCVHASPAYHSNGYASRTRGMASGMDAAGFDVVVLSRPGYPWDTRTDREPVSPHRHVVDLAGIPFVAVPGPHLENDRPDRYVLRAADAVVREARRQRPAVIQAASNHQTALPALVAARRLGVPFLYEVRGLWEVTGASARPGWEASDRYAMEVAFETRVALEADRVLAITEQVADELVARGVPRERISIVPNAVDVDEYRPLPADEDLRLSLGLRPGVPTAGFAGSVVAYEGLDDLVRSAAELKARGVASQVVIAGSGSASAELAALVAELGVDEEVKLLGRLPPADVPRLLNLLDVVVNPRRSLPVTEMVSALKPLEAMGAGVAVVLSDVSPNRDLAGPDQERAVLVPPGDSHRLAEALERLFASPDERRRLSTAGRHWTTHERNWPAVGKLTREAHEQARLLHEAIVAAQEPHELAEMTVAVVADEFTFETLSRAVSAVRIDRATWRDQMTERRYDALFVESAWEANKGEWTRGVGYYGEEEFADLAGIIAAARDAGTPTIFWNKEDPVHFGRFQKTAARFDHVFTTDADKIIAYMETPGTVAATVASLSFYAEPRIHNPLPVDRDYEHVVSYAGTFYGERFAERSRELASLLSAAATFGLAIYDRQYDKPDSPYRFPAALQRHVRGSLPYGEVLDAYRAHPVHINVNSVEDSPTMFSRRVVEIAASGSVVLSGRGRGVQDVLGDAIPAPGSQDGRKSLLEFWMTNEAARNREAWLQMRTVLRAHTAGHALALMFRTAGFPVAAPRLPDYGVWVPRLTSELGAGLAAQSVRPRLVTAAAADQDALHALSAVGVEVAVVGSGAVDVFRRAGVEWVGTAERARPRTYYEDLLLATHFGDWRRLRSEDLPPLVPAGVPLALPSYIADATDGLVRVDGAGAGELVSTLLRAAEPIGLVWRQSRPPECKASGESSDAAAARSETSS